MFGYKRESCLPFAILTDQSNVNQNRNFGTAMKMYIVRITKEHKSKSTGIMQIENRVQNLAGF